MFEQNPAFFLDLILMSMSTLLHTFCSVLIHVLLLYYSTMPPKCLALHRRPNQLRQVITHSCQKQHRSLVSNLHGFPIKVHQKEPNICKKKYTAVTRGHFDAWSTDQESPIVILIWQTRFTEIAVSRKL